MNTTKKILITGANGFLGSTLMVNLHSEECLPIAFEGDITDIPDIEKAFEQDLDAVIHTAGKIEIPWCEENPGEARRINVEGTKKLLEAARKKNIPFIFISTVSVFSGSVGDYRESDVREPVNTYSKTKAEAEDYTLLYEKGYVVRLNLLGVRPDGKPGKNFFEWVLTTARQGESLRLFTDQRTNPISNWTVARALRILLTKLPTEHVLHLGTKEPLSKFESAVEILTRFGTSTETIVPIRTTDFGDGIQRPKEMWLNTDLASEILFPMPSFKEELETIARLLSF